MDKEIREIKKKKIYERINQLEKDLKIEYNIIERAYKEKSGGLSPTLMWRRYNKYSNEINYWYKHLKRYSHLK